MKPDMHPVYPPSRITCACGNVVESKSTRGSFSVEICSNCHPFFTGKYKLMDTAGRVEKFRKKYGTKAAIGGGEGAPAEGAAAKPAEGAAAAKPAAGKKADKAEKAPKKAEA